MLATCAHASRPPRRTPVSSLCSTRALLQRRFELRLHRREHARGALDPAHQRAPSQPQRRTDRRGVAGHAPAARAAPRPSRPPVPAAAAHIAPGLAPRRGRRPRSPAGTPGSARAAPDVPLTRSRTAGISCTCRRSRRTSGAVGERGLAVHTDAPGDAPRSRRESPPDAASRHDAPVARPPSSRSACAGSSSSAPARHSRAAWNWCGYPAVA